MATLVSDLIEQAIRIAGSEKKLGKLAGYSQNAIWSAKRNGRVTGELAQAIDRATDGRISKYDLRPDLFERAAATTTVTQSGAAA